MACKDCGKERITGVCKVCEIVDGDSSNKIVTFCIGCQVYICEACNSNLSKRWAAFKAELKRKALKLKDFIIKKIPK